MLFVCQDIVYSKWRGVREMGESSGSQDDGGTLVATSRTSKTASELKIADSFRLWITTQSDIGRLIPGKVVFNKT